MENKLIAEKLIENRSLAKEEYLKLLEGYTPQFAEYLAQKAREEKQRIYKNKVFIRGLIEISNICKNDCLYCGIRKSNKECSRYRIEPDEILALCRKGYKIGFRTFVLQGGEDGFYSDEVLVNLIKAIKTQFPDCAVTLSLGERSRGSYEALKKAGADRYLLRHETASSLHYSKLHPQNLSFENRMECLKNLKELGFQTGCGFMVGSPYQTLENIAEDLKFIEEFSPEMCGIGPFIPHKNTPFKDFKAGSADLTCYLLSIVRLIKPNILLPATTALGTAEADGRERGILSGANVIMPNLSPQENRKKYELYNNKISTGAESAEELELLKEKMRAIGSEISIERGDIASEGEKKYE